MARKRESIPTLAQHGLLFVGTVLELVPDYRPGNAAAGDPRFRAVIVRTNGRQRAIRWEADGQLYSLTGLTGVLYQNHGIEWPGKTCLNWRRQSQHLTIWEEAEQYAR